MRMRYVDVTALMVFLLCAVFTGKAFAAQARIPLYRSNPAGIELARYPVSIGVPMPVGLLRGEPLRVALHTPDGRHIPAQFKPLARWWGRDGSVSALSVTFIANTAHERYVLEVGRRAEPPKPSGGGVTIKQNGNTITVINGIIRARIGRVRGTLLEWLAYDANRDGRISGDEIVVPCAGDGMRSGEFASVFGAPESVEIEESGPIRAIACIRGKMLNRDGEAFMSYIVRMHFYAGIPLIRIDFTFVQDTREIFVDVPFVDLSMPLNLSDEYVALFGTEPPSKSTQLKFATVNAKCTDAVRIVQLGPEHEENIAMLNYEPFRKMIQERKRWWSERERQLWEEGPRRREFTYEVVRNDAVIARGGKSFGWVRIEPRGKAWALTAGIRHFWQNYPKEIAIEGGALHLCAYPIHADEPLHLHIGTAKTHSAFIFVNGRDGCDEALEIVRAFDEPPIYFPSVDWYCESKLWGNIVPRRKGKFRLFEVLADRAIEYDFQKRRERLNGYGMLDFGDIPWGSNTWANLETAYDHGLFIHFIRTGKRIYFDLFEQAVWHFRDVDVNRADVDGIDWGLWLMPGYIPERLAKECAVDEQLRKQIFYWTGTQPPGKGCVRRHSYRHFGNIVERHPVPFESRYEYKRGKCYSGSCDVGGHGWIVGLVDHYLATGDRRSLEVAELAGEWVLKRPHLRWGRDNWKHIDLMALYRATGKREYLDQVRRAIDFVYAHRNEVVKQMREQMRTHLSPYYTILQFVREYHQATGDGEIGRKYVEIINTWFENLRYVKSSLGDVFDYIRDYEDSRCHTDFADLAYAYLLTGDRRYIDRSLASFRLYMHFAYHSTCLFAVPEYLYALSKLGIDVLNEPPPTMRGAKRAYWRDERDDEFRVWVCQEAGFRVPAKPLKGFIRITAPDGSIVAEKEIGMGGLDVREFVIPRDGKRGVYRIDASAEGLTFSYAATGRLGKVEVGMRPPEIVRARFGNGVLLAEGATVTFPVKGNLNPNEGTIEIFFKPLWSSPERRERDVPYRYHYLFDSRDEEYDYGFQIYFWDSGKRCARKALIAGWGDYNKGDSLSVPVTWEKETWHHIAFAWRKLGNGRAIGRLYLDGKLVASRDDMTNFPTRLHHTITLGMNTPRNHNTPLEGVIDWLRISDIMRERLAMEQPQRDERTLLLSTFD